VFSGGHIYHVLLFFSVSIHPVDIQPNQPN
jgi:hypothetical protein